MTLVRVPDSIVCRIVRGARGWITAVFAIGVLPACMIAQRAPEAGISAAPVHARSCLDSIPPSEMVRMMGFIEGGAHLAFGVGADDSKPADAFLVNAADAFTEDVATETRQQLGARGDTLPIAEPVVTWRGIGDALVVTVRRDGVVRWRATHNAGDSSGAMLLGRAVAVVQNGPSRLAWPADAKGDSASFLIRFLVPSQDHKGHPQQIEVRAPFPAFSVSVPIEDPVTTKHQARIDYPHVSAAAGISATILMRFVVDASGAAVDSTIRDTWPADVPRLNASDAAAYRTFVTAVRNGIRDSRYEPARVGGCPVSQATTQPFIFNIYK